MKKLAIFCFLCCFFAANVEAQQFDRTYRRVGDTQIKIFHLCQVETVPKTASAFALVIYVMDSDSTAKATYSIMSADQPCADVINQLENQLLDFFKKLSWFSLTGNKLADKANLGDGFHLVSQLNPSGEQFQLILYQPEKGSVGIVDAERVSN